MLYPDFVIYLFLILPIKVKWLALIDAVLTGLAFTFGTWQIKGEDAVRATATALATGYRHLDIATVYGNEGEVGRALADSGGARDEVFVTTPALDIPTVYDGPDLDETASRSKVSGDELVALHTGREYRAYFLGFLPGFAYCGTLDRRIVAPRLGRPREHVPAGAVAVAEGQTAVYPLDSPGGWRLIGRTDTRIFDPSKDPPTLIRPGDRVRFVAR